MQTLKKITPAKLASKGACYSEEKCKGMIGDKGDTIANIFDLSEPTVDDKLWVLILSSDASQKFLDQVILYLSDKNDYNPIRQKYRDEAVTKLASEDSTIQKEGRDYLLQVAFNTLISPKYEPEAQITHIKQMILDAVANDEFYD